MKIKGDFITNSSSSAYVICLPHNFTIEDIDTNSDNYKEFLSTFEDWYEDQVDLPQGKEYVERELMSLLKHLIYDLERVDEPIEYGGINCSGPYRGLSGVEILFEKYILFDLDCGDYIPHRIMNLNSMGYKHSMQLLNRILKGEIK